jgi:hypothetical protein
MLVSNGASQQGIRSCSSTLYKDNNKLTKYLESGKYCLVALIFKTNIRYQAQSIYYQEPSGKNMSMSSQHYPDLLRMFLPSQLVGLVLNIFLTLLMTSVTTTAAILNLARSKT